MLEAPIVRVFAPRAILPPVAPPPVNEPIWVLKPVISRPAPATFARVTAELLPKAPLTPAVEATPAFKVPALMVVAPVKVFAPARVTVPVPCLIICAPPEITPVDFILALPVK